MNWFFHDLIIKKLAYFYSSYKLYFTRFYIQSKRLVMIFNVLKWFLFTFLLSIKIDFNPTWKKLYQLLSLHFVFLHSRCLMQKSCLSRFVVLYDFLYSLVSICLFISRLHFKFHTYQVRFHDCSHSEVKKSSNFQYINQES